jgi:hypothetical protein
MLATQTEVSNGALHTIALGIPYFEQSDISVSFEQDAALTLGIDYVWSAANTITFLPTVATPGGVVPFGVTVVLRRTTQSDVMYNVYDGGAPFSRAALDENFRQLLYRAQEFSEGLGIDGVRNQLNMNGYRITHLGYALDGTDALPKGQADTLFVNVSGDTMTGPLGLGGNRITGLGTPVTSTDAARLEDVHLEELARQAGDAGLQAQLNGTVPPIGTAFSPVSWHRQTIENSIVVPAGMNAWSFGPRVRIATGQSVTVSEGAFWTIANGAQTQEGPLVAELPANLDYGVLP